MTPENQLAVSRLLAGHKTWMVLCVDSAEDSNGETKVYNSSVLVNPQGKGTAIYHKRRLVMFGEYIPFVRWLHFLKFLAPIGDGFSPGSEPVQFQTFDPSAKLSVLICFEDVFAAEARLHADPDTDFLINLTNDGWFGDGASQWQQTACAVFRAIENGLPLARCSNNGITCWIDAKGRLRQVLGNSTNVYSPGILNCEIPLKDGPSSPRTFYNAHGDVFAFACAIYAVLSFALSVRKNALNSHPQHWDTLT